MNKIYKVIWSKVRNCYVAVSEIAKAMLADGMEISKVAKLTNLSVKEVTALA